MIGALYWLFNTVVDLIIFLIFATVIMSWLVAFRVLNPHNQLVGQIDRGLRALTDPILMPVRRIIPALGGLDISPLVVLLLLEFIRRVVDSLILGGGVLGGF